MTEVVWTKRASLIAPYHPALTRTFSSPGKGELPWAVHTLIDETGWPRYVQFDGSALPLPQESLQGGGEKKVRPQSITEQPRPRRFSSIQVRACGAHGNSLPVRERNRSVSARMGLRKNEDACRDICLFFLQTLRTMNGKWRRRAGSATHD